MREKLSSSDESPLSNQDNLKHILSFKKKEKLRRVKESEVVDQYFNYYKFLKEEKIYFQNMSYEIMKKINHAFEIIINKPGKV